MWLVAMAVFVGVAAGVAAVVVLSGDDDGSDVADDGVQELVLEPIGAAGADPFTDSVAVEEVEVATAVSLAEGQQGGAELTVAGTQPELYGGSGEAQVCDAGALVAFLGENPEEAAAFAEVFGISPEGIGDYVAGLTPVLLRVDTRVTNHGFRDGEATPFQAVLQAGTAVLVDAFGVPRVKCNCGNPLDVPAALPDALPAAEESGQVALVGDPWPTWEPAQAVAVSAGEEEVAEFTVVDIETDEVYTTPVGVDVTGGSELVLAPDGLGVVSFGQPNAEVEAVLTELLGPPDDRFVCDFNLPGNECTAHEPQGTYLRWDGLDVYLNSISGVFEHYSRGGVFDPQTQQLVPQDEPVAATPEGIEVGSTSEELFAAFPALQRTDCDPEGYETLLSPAQPGDEGKLITALDGYSFVVREGTVQTINHGVDDQFNSLGCGP